MSSRKLANEAQRQRLERRNEKIRRRYHNLSEKKVSGRRVFTNEYIIHKIADEFYLAERTIEAIVFESKQ